HPDAEDLVIAVAVAHERDEAALRDPAGLRVERGALRDAPNGSIRQPHVDVAVTAAHAREDDPLPAPVRLEVPGLVERDPGEVTAVGSADRVEVTPTRLRAREH